MRTTTVYRASRNPARPAPRMMIFTDRAPITMTFDVIRDAWKEPENVTETPAPARRPRRWVMPLSCASIVLGLSMMAVGFLFNDPASRLVWSWLQ